MCIIKEADSRPRERGLSAVVVSVARTGESGAREKERKREGGRTRGAREAKFGRARTRELSTRGAEGEYPSTRASHLRARESVILFRERSVAMRRWEICLRSKKGSLRVDWTTAMITVTITTTMTMTTRESRRRWRNAGVRRVGSSALVRPIGPPAPPLPVAVLVLVLLALRHRTPLPRCAVDDDETKTCTSRVIARASQRPVPSRPRPSIRLSIRPGGVTSRGFTRRDPRRMGVPLGRQGRARSG